MNWPEIAFEAGNFLYASSFVDAASRLTGVPLDDICRACENKDGMAQIIPGGSLLVAGKVSVLRFEERFGQVVRSEALAIPATMGPKSTDLYVGGAVLRSFCDIRSKQLTYLHLFHRNCSLLCHDEMLQIVSRFERTPNCSCLRIGASKRGKFNSDFDLASDVSRRHGGQLAICSRLSEVSVTARRIEMRVQFDGITEVELYGLITSVLDAAVNETSIAMVAFS
ncbi:MAG TPA: hypothetical protein DDZ51_04330 [Planctomycetaceae bacterium]|nr:hypothetical protein [Planctomycetaceae bacterium]